MNTLIYSNAFSFFLFLFFCLVYLNKFKLSKSYPIWATFEASVNVARDELYFEEEAGKGQGCSLRNGDICRLRWDQGLRGLLSTRTARTTLANWSEAYANPRRGVWAVSQRGRKTGHLIPTGDGVIRVNEPRRNPAKWMVPSLPSVALPDQTPD